MHPEPTLDFLTSATRTCMVQPRSHSDLLCPSGPHPSLDQPPSCPPDTLGMLSLGPLCPLHLDVPPPENSLRSFSSPLKCHPHKKDIPCTLCKPEPLPSCCCHLFTLPPPPCPSGLVVIRLESFCCMVLLPCWNVSFITSCLLVCCSCPGPRTVSVSDKYWMEGRKGEMEWRKEKGEGRRREGRREGGREEEEEGRKEEERISRRRRKEGKRRRKGRGGREGGRKEGNEGGREKGGGRRQKEGMKERREGGRRGASGTSPIKSPHLPLHLPPADHPQGWE